MDPPWNPASEEKELTAVAELRGKKRAQNQNNQKAPGGRGVVHFPELIIITGREVGGQRKPESCSGAFALDWGRRKTTLKGGRIGWENSLPPPTTGSNNEKELHQINQSNQSIPPCMRACGQVGLRLQVRDQHIS